MAQDRVSSEVEPLDPGTRIRRDPVGRSRHHALGWQLFLDHGTAAKKARRTDFDATVDTDLSGQETALAQPYSATEPDMGRNKTIVADLSVMTNVVAAPHHQACADTHKRLDDIGFQDEAILSD